MSRHVIIIGNGFDLFLGRKTKYSDFYKSDIYCPKDYPAPLIDYLNQWQPTRGLNDVKWFDFETELYNYSQINHDIKDPISQEEHKVLAFIKERNCPVSANEISDFLYVPSNESGEVYVLYNNPEVEIRELFLKQTVCILEKMVERHLLSQTEELKLYYLKDPVYAESKEVRDKEAFKKIKSGLRDYLLSQPFSHTNDEALRNRLNSIFEMDKFDQIEVFTFNYTDVPWPEKADVQYVHGKIKDDTIVIGTKEYNETNNAYKFLQKAMDDNFNPPAIIDSLLTLGNGDKVTFFGHSLGENDQQYFRDFIQARSTGVTYKNLTIEFVLKSLNDKQYTKMAIQDMSNYQLTSFQSKNKVIFKSSEDL